VLLFSARHEAEAHVLPPLTQDGLWQVTFAKGPPAVKLCRGLPEMPRRMIFFAPIIRPGPGTSIPDLGLRGGGDLPLV